MHLLSIHLSAAGGNRLNVRDDRNCLGGVDEAGLGPILGPLVVAGVALTGPRGTDPWQRLRRVVSRKAPRKGRVQVADSKRVHQGPHGKRRLEMAVLSFWGAWRGRLPADLRALLSETGNDPDVLRSCPWYEDLSVALPLFNDRPEVELRAHLLQRELARRSIEVLHLGARLVEVEEFNRLIADTDNKSHTHFHAYSAVIADLIRRIPAGSHLVADRCGGRVHYRGSLRRIYPGAEVRTLRESDDVSEYDLRRAKGAVRITFATQGEDRSFSTALASCVAKYVRELAVHVLNQWFAARVPGLAPTAGYYQDGRRFLADIDDFVRSRALPVERLVRVR